MRCDANDRWLGRALGALIALCAAHGSARAELLSLAELERRAVVQRASLQAAGARTAAARSAVELSEAPYHPTLQASVTGDVAPGSRLVHVTDTAGDDYLMTGSRAIGDPGALIPDVRYGAQLSLSGRLYDFGRTAASVRVRRAELAAAGFEQQAEELAVIREVQAAYLAWLWAFVTRDVRKASLASARSLRESLEARVLEGSRSGANVTPARSSEASLELSAEESEFDLAAARADLERATGVKLPAGAEPDTALLDLAAPAAPPRRSVQEAALERRRDALAATNAARRVTKLPVLSAGADLGVRGQGETVFPLYRVGVAVTIPLLDGGTESATSDLAQARATEAVAVAGEARAELVLEREKARLLLEHAERKLVLARRLLAIADDALRQAEDRAKLGDGELDPLREARLQRSNAELGLLSVRVERVRAILALESTAGEARSAAKRAR